MFTISECPPNRGCLEPIPGIAMAIGCDLREDADLAEDGKQPRNDIQCIVSFEGRAEYPWATQVPTERTATREIQVRAQGTRCAGRAKTVPTISGLSL